MCLVCYWVSDTDAAEKPLQGALAPNAGKLWPLLQAAPTMSLCDCVAPYAVIPLEGATGCGVSGWMYPLLSIRLPQKTKQHGARE